MNSSITLENNDTLTFNDSVLTLGAISESSQLFPIPTTYLLYNIISTVPHRQILRASFKPETRTLSIPYIAKEKKKNLFSLVLFEGIVQESNTPHAESWVESLMKTVYEGKSRLSFVNIVVSTPLSINPDAGIKRSRKLLVLINPYSGRASYRMFNGSTSRSNPI
jgi:hypothetical protein